MVPDRNKYRLLVITSIKDEIQTIEAMAESVLEQTHPFQEWIIVDDCSTDGTSDVLKQLDASQSSIRALTLSDPAERALGARITQIVELGLHAATNDSWSHWAKLDADLILAPDFFERILERFALEPKLGIASGKAMLPTRDGGWRNEWIPDYFPLGMARIYQRTCWSEIGGFVPARHFDILDVYTARYKGWQTASIPETTVKLLRRVDERMPGQLRRRAEAGADLYSIGYHPSYLLLRAVRSMWDERPLLAAGFAMLLGYLSGWIRSERRVDEDLFDFIRSEQRQMLNFTRFRRYWTSKGTPRDQGT